MYDLKEGVGAERLADKGIGTEASGIFLVSRHGRHQNTTFVRELFFDRRYQFEPVYFGHIDVSENDVRTQAGFKRIEGVKTIVKQLNFTVDTVRQDRRDKISDDFVIINNRDFDMGNDGSPQATFKKSISPTGR